MTFAGESAFENHLREIIESRITAENSSLYALTHKAIGDIVIARDGDSPAVFFLEVKYFQPSNLRLGLGHGSGAGIQPEILRRRPAYLETHYRWILGSDAHDGHGYWFATSDVIRRYVSGGGIGEKQNNIQQRLFREHPSVDATRLVEQLRRWLSI